MTNKRAAALRAERDEVVALCENLTEEEWKTPSRCAGWTVQDVVAHMGAACHGTFTPWVVKLMFTGDLEAGNDSDVDKRRSRGPAKVFKEYAKWSTRFCGIQGMLQAPPLKGLPVRLGEMGTYPARQLTNAIIFDTGLHLRYDIATAIDKKVPPADEVQTEASLEWMMAGIPNMSGDRLGWVDRPLEFRLKGVGATSYFVHPGKKIKVTQEPAANPAAVVIADTAEFPIWSTRREPWREHDVEVRGDEAFGTKFLDDFQVI